MITTLMIYNVKGIDILMFDLKGVYLHVYIYA